MGEKSYRGELTNEELALLNNLMYIESVTNKEWQTVQDYIDELRRDGLESLDNPEDKFDLNAEEWNQVLTSIEKNPKLSNLKMRYPEKDTLSSQIVTFVDGNNNATVVFRGTGKGEWRDNANGGYLVTTEQQQKALDYINSLPYSNITVSGHSKGGNKAQYVTIASKKTDTSKIDRCVSFDGQGFSKKFCNEYKDEIDKYRGLITQIAPSDDYVNVLMMQIAGNVIYTKAYNNIECNFLGFNHGEMAAEHMADKVLRFDKSGNPYIQYETTRDPVSDVIHNFLLYIMENASDSEIEILLKELGAVADNAVDEDEYETYLAKAESHLCVFPAIDVLEKYALLYFASDISPIILPLIIRILYKLPLKPVNLDLNMIHQIGSGKILAKDVKTKSIKNFENNKFEKGTFSETKNITRDFTEFSKWRLKDLIGDIEEEKFYNITKWDVWYRIEDLFGNLDVENYSNDIDTYHRKIMDIKGITKEKIDEIYENVNEIDNQYSNKFKEINSRFHELRMVILEINSSLNVVNVEVAPINN